MASASNLQPPRLFVIGSFVEAHCWFASHRPGSDESQLASAYVRECAGKGLAVALGAHRLGAAVDLLVGVGHDAAGDALLDLLQREGLDNALVHRLGPHSGQGCGLISAQGDTTVTVYPGANALLGVRELQRAAPRLRQAEVVYAQLEAPHALVAEALRQAHAAGATTVLNPSPWPRAASPDDLSALLAGARVLVVNQGEAAALADHLGGAAHASPANWLGALWRAWPAGQWLVITLGAQGCVAYGPGGDTLRLGGHAVAAVQPIGAGDAFAAGLCSALARGEPMADALRTANACGALAASRDGILAALPGLVEVQALLQTHEQAIGQR